MQMATRAAAAERRRRKPLAKQIEEDLEHLEGELSLPEINGLLTCLWQRKEAMEKQESQVKMQLLLQFLHHARRDPGPSAPHRCFAGTARSPETSRHHRLWHTPQSCVSKALHILCITGRQSALVALLP